MAYYQCMFCGKTRPMNSAIGIAIKCSKWIGMCVWQKQ
ncbi:hypothetical protein BD847_2366 [Flavobacterium cutihirudinis]|uniref:Uncharacterized protein n=1 Tax=Flavobacterium cutihirudinis TaxID=1265740 RepID=A0A3D9FRY9_9FLAO|nr:hypothetical protein BD847_2366 [Flavobacterium cutihirudinis]